LGKHRAWCAWAGSGAVFVSLHLPSTIETRHLIGESELSVCRQECVLINASQPDIVDLQDLNAALERSVIKGAAIVSHADNIESMLGQYHSNLQIEEEYASAQRSVERDVAVELADKVAQLLRIRQPGNPLSLLVVDVDRVILHEHFDPERVTNLAERLESAGTLVNPPVVVEWEDHYIVLDGATRTNAFRQLSFPHIVVQIVPADDERLLLQSWHHILCAVSERDLLNHLQGFKSYELKPENDTSGVGFDETERTICRLRLINGEKYLVETILGVDRLVAMNEFVADYTEICRIERTLNTDLKELSNDYVDMAALVVFPQFTIKDVLQSAIKGQLLPAGITRFVIPGRVLRLHADLKCLKSDDPLARKNAWLDRLLAEKMARRRIRYYQESVFLLDE